MKKGFNIGYRPINSPHSIGVKAKLIYIMIQATQNDMLGGQSHPNCDNDLTPYVDITRQKIHKEVM